MEEQNPDQATSLSIDAYPTRDFFVSMIVKDVDLIPAIIDLVDNCLDGAKRLKGKGPYNRLRVEINFDQQHFQITDNCGGIDVETAKSYAFCFGRPEGGRLLKGSVGRFGIGMKRALFKLGREFEVESRSASSKFRVHVDVDAWLGQKDEWHFDFAEPPSENIVVPASRQGTTIRVSRLHDTVAEEFRLDSFSDSLAEEIESKHSESLAKGLKVKVNRRSLRARPLELRSSRDVRPALKVFSRTALHPNDVRIRMLAGLGRSDPLRAGWYLFCNDRMIMEADQSENTGWNVRGSTPRFHNQYAEFRGYVFMNSDDALGLPWNTTKTSVDTSSPIFKSVRNEMVQMLQPVTRFLNRLKEEKDRRRKRGKGVGPIETAITAAPLKRLSSFRKQQPFKFPIEPLVRQRPQVATITYTVSPGELRKAKDTLDVKSNAEVGRLTFEYYMEMEGGG